MPTMTNFALKLTFAMLAVALCVAGQTAPPSTDIFLVDVLKRGGQLALGTPVNITFRPGYDNQPSFTPDGKSLPIAFRNLLPPLCPGVQMAQLHAQHRRLQLIQPRIHPHRCAL